MLASLRFVATFAIFLVIAGHAQSSGWVLSASGKWTAVPPNGPKRLLEPGAVVNPGENLNSDPADAELGLVLYDGTYLRCGRNNPQANKANCKQPIAIPARSKPKGVLAAFLDQLQNKHLPPVAFVTSRGPEDTPPVELRDAVVTAAGNKLDLAAVLSTTAPVELHFYLEPLDAPDGCKDLIFTLAKSAHTADAPDFKPQCNGLYALSSTDDSMRSAYPATVLFVSPAAQPRAAEMLQDASAVTGQWQVAGENEVRTFRRLTLGAIQQRLRSSR